MSESLSIGKATHTQEEEWLVGAADEAEPRRSWREMWFESVD